MFFAIVFIVIGVVLLLNAFGILAGNFWGFFWALFFIVVGLKMLVKKEGCPMCGWHRWEKGMHGKMHGHCCEHGEHEHHEGEDEEEQK
jgi:hypothetical protein